MLIANKKTMSLGVFLGVTFLGVLVLIFSPVWGQGKNGLQFSDNLFNSLAKGSAYYIPEVSEKIKKYEKQKLVVTIKMKDDKEAAAALKVLSKTAPNTTLQGAVLKVDTPLVELLRVAVGDSDQMYSNNGAAISQKYGMDEKKALESFYGALKGASKSLQTGAQRNVPQSAIIEEVMTKAMEPGYNFYKIRVEHSSQKMGLLSGLLAFYILYTLWWGFAIYFMFDGLGLSMTKPKVKREV